MHLINFIYPDVVIGTNIGRIKKVRKFISLSWSDPNLDKKKLTAWKRTTI